MVSSHRTTTVSDGAACKYRPLVYYQSKLWTTSVEKDLFCKSIIEHQLASHQKHMNYCILKKYVGQHLMGFTLTYIGSARFTRKRVGTRIALTTVHGILLLFQTAFLDFLVTRTTKKTITLRRGLFGRPELRVASFTAEEECATVKDFSNNIFLC